MKKKLNKHSAQSWDRVTVHLTKKEDRYLNLDSSETAPACISLKYFDSGYQCFSDWEKSELREFSNFINKLRQLPWKEIPRHSGLRKKDHKTRKSLPDRDILTRISQETTFFELRVTGESRVHGFRVKSTFFLVWLDRQHDIYP